MSSKNSCLSQAASPYLRSFREQLSSFIHLSRYESQTVLLPMHHAVSVSFRQPCPKSLP